MNKFSKGTHIDTATYKRTDGKQILVLNSYNGNEGQLERSEKGDVGLGAVNNRRFIGPVVGNHIWLIDSSTGPDGGKAFCYTYGTSGKSALIRNQSKDITLPPETYRGGFSIGNRVWFVRWGNVNGIGYVYEGSVLKRNTALDFSSFSGGLLDLAIIGCFSIGNNAWVITTGAFRGYTMREDGVLERNTDLDTNQTNLGLGHPNPNAGQSPAVVDNRVWFHNDSILSPKLIGFTYNEGSFTRDTTIDKTIGEEKVTAPDYYNGVASIRNNVWALSNAKMTGYRVINGITLKDWTSLGNITKGIVKGTASNNKFLQPKGSYETEVFDLNEIREYYISTPIAHNTSLAEPFTLGQVERLGDLKKIIVRTDSDTFTGAPFSLNSRFALFVAYSETDDRLSDFVRFTSGNYKGRYFKFKMELNSFDGGYSTPEVFDADFNFYYD